MAKKRTTTKKRVKTVNLSTLGEIQLERVLIENFTSLQKVMTNLAVKFDNLSGQLSKLLDLFEISAKTLAEKGAFIEDNGLAEKLDNLIEQNKVIARGVAMIHEKESEPQYLSPPRMQSRPAPYPIPQPVNKINKMEGYQESAEFSTNQNMRR